MRTWYVPGGAVGPAVLAPQRIIPGNVTAAGYRRSHVTEFIPGATDTFAKPPPPRPPRPPPPPWSAPAAPAPPGAAAAPRPPPAPPRPAAVAGALVNVRMVSPFASRMS